MESIKIKIEQRLTVFTTRVIAWRWALGALMVVLAVASVSRLPHLRRPTSMMKMRTRSTKKKPDMKFPKI